MHGPTPALAHAALVSPHTPGDRAQREPLVPDKVQHLLLRRRERGLEGLQEPVEVHDARNEGHLWSESCRRGAGLRGIRVGRRDLGQAGLCAPFGPNVPGALRVYRRLRRKLAFASSDARLSAALRVNPLGHDPPRLRGDPVGVAALGLAQGEPRRLCRVLGFLDVTSVSVSRGLCQLLRHG